MQQLQACLSSSADDTDGFNPGRGKEPCGDGPRHRRSDIRQPGTIEQYRHRAARLLFEEHHQAVAGRQTTARILIEARSHLDDVVLLSRERAAASPGVDLINSLRLLSTNLGLAGYVEGVSGDFVVLRIWEEWRLDAA